MYSCSTTSWILVGAEFPTGMFPSSPLLVPALLGIVAFGIATSSRKLLCMRKRYDKSLFRGALLIKVQNECGDVGKIFHYTVLFDGYGGKL